MPINLYESDIPNVLQTADGKKFTTIPQEYRPLEHCYNCGVERQLYYEDSNEHYYCNECVRLK